MRKLLPILTVLLTIAALACGSAQQAADNAVEESSPLAQSAAPDTAAAPAVPAAPSNSASEPAPTSAPSIPSSAAPLPAPVSQAAAMVPEPESNVPQGGVFTRLWSDPPTLDPARTGDTRSAGIVVEIFGGLVTFDVDLNIIPDLAESWEISSDGTVYTFHLRPNAKFHDGKQVTARDFEYSLNRTANPDTASQTADTYLGDIIGARDVIEGNATKISGVTVIDDLTLQIKIDAPKPYFLAKMTYPTAYVVDQINVESGGSSWTKTPNGTGPFKLKEYKISERIVLERFDDFHLRPAHIDEVFMNLSGGQAMAMYENGEIDITGVGLFDLDRILDPNEELNKQLVVAPPDFSTTYIGFNPTKPPFDDTKFRQALSHAIQKDLIAEQVLSGLVQPAYGILPPGFPGYSPDIEGLRYDPDLAQQLLADSDYADAATRPRIVITTPGTGGTIGPDLEVIIEMWRQTLGVEVEIQQSEWATFLQDLNGKKFQAFAGLSWQADYPDPQDFLEILFHTDSETNHGAYSNLELDAILDKAGVEGDVSVRLDLYNQAEQIIVADAAWLPLWYTGDRHVLIKDRIKNYTPTPMTISKLRYVYIEE